LVTPAVHCEFLRKLKWTAMESCTDSAILKVVRKSSKIQTLIFQECKSLTDTGISNVASVLLTNLRNLSLCHCCGIKGSCLATIAECCPNLTELRLDGLVSVDTSFGLTFPSLSVCSLQSSNTTYEQMESLLLHNPHLEMLDVSYCPHISSDQIQHLKNNYPNQAIEYKIVG